MTSFFQFLMSKVSSIGKHSTLHLKMATKASFKFLWFLIFNFNQLDKDAALDDPGPQPCFLFQMTVYHRGIYFIKPGYLVVCLMFPFTTSRLCQFVPQVLDQRNWIQIILNAKELPKIIAYQLPSMQFKNVGRRNLVESCCSLNLFFGTIFFILSDGKHQKSDSSASPFSHIVPVTMQSTHLQYLQCVFFPYTYISIV